jgi:hypothetical protein
MGWQLLNKGLKTKGETQLQRFREPLRALKLPKEALRKSARTKRKKGRKR